MKINGVFFNGDYYIEHNENGLKVLGFDIYKNESAYLECIPEALVEEKLFYRIKLVEDNGKYLKVECELDLNTFKVMKLKTRTFTAQTIKNMLEYMKFDYTIQGNFDNELRSITVNNATSYDVLMEMQKQFNIFLDFDNRNKIITCIYKEEIQHRGLYITEQLNIISTDSQVDTYDFCNRIYAYGKDDITFASVNNGKDYVEDLSYSTQLIGGIIVDTTIDNPNQLLALAKNTLAEKAKPNESYTFKVFNLSKLKDDDYSLKDIKVNDIVKYIDRDRKRETYHRVVKYKEYPHNPSLDEITLASNKSSSVKNAILNATSITNITNGNLDVYDKAVLYINKVMNDFHQQGNIIQTGSEIYIVNELPKETATQIIRIDKNGIAFSDTWNGIYTYGFTGMIPIGTKIATYKSGILISYE